LIGYLWEDGNIHWQMASKNIDSKFQEPIDIDGHGGFTDTDVAF
jgi:hypothetical protein